MMLKIQKASFFQKIVLPALLAIVLFIISVFAFIIPAFEANVMDEKRQMLHELTNTAWSILNKYHDDSKQGLISPVEAQKQAISRIEALRYGTDRKDYFWITDLKPVMVMHPYVHELNGKSLQDYTDPDGIKLFMEALKIAQTKGEGFVSYRWQFNDDSKRIVSKLSFVKKFKPWNWIIGTGIYLDDVQNEISKLIQKLIFISLAIVFIISLIIFFITHQSLKIEKSRSLAEEQLRESKEKYRSLIESSTEGIILLLNDKISYSNLFIQNLLGLSNDELLQCNINDLLHDAPLIFSDQIKEEVRYEVVLIKHDFSFTEAVLTILPVSFADKQGLLLTIRDTSENRSVKNELEILKTQIDNISNFSNLYMFRFSVQDKIQLINFDTKMVSLLGYENEEELKKISLRQILANKNDLKFIMKGLKKKQSLTNMILPLKRKDGDVFNTRLNLFFNNNQKGKIDFCDGFIELNVTQISPVENDYISEAVLSVIARSNQCVDEFKRNIISCPFDAPLLSAVNLMNIHKSDFILIMNNDNCVGLLTFKDIISGYFKSGCDVNFPVFNLMTAPVISIDDHAKLNDAFLLISQKNCSHIVVKNNSGEYTGVLDWNSIRETYLDPSDLLFKAINHCNSIQELSDIRKQISGLIGPLINETASVRSLNKLISLLNDGITNKVIQIALQETGIAPVPFSFFTFGSAGREELVLNSDQDNAIIFQDNETIPFEALQKYFLTLADKICKYLDASGLEFCKGGYMAQNPKWCQPLSVWKKYFAEWIVITDTVHLLNLSVFFDLRCQYGEQKLFKELEDFVYESLIGRSTFFYNLAQSIAGYRPPLNVFGNIVTETSGRHIDMLDVKNCLAPVIMFTRIYSLSNGIRKTGTLSRIDELNHLGILSNSTVEELRFHFNFMMQIRLRHQIDQIKKNTEPDNFISPKKLSEMELVILKKVFSQMNGFQAKLNAGFMS